MSDAFNVVRVVGARPQFMQAKPLTEELLRRGHRQVLVHTGQHYDDPMSRVFFEELGLPEPDVNLDVGSAPQGAQTGRMMEALERFLLESPCDAVIVDGDTNSTLAGALAAAKLHVPVVHVEAGLRSFDQRMPEEINRVVTDHVARVLCAPTPTAVDNLAREGITDGVVQTGDLMYDCFVTFRAQACRHVLEQLNVRERGYFLATVHRADNTDDPDRLGSILDALSRLPAPVVFPVHPRTRPGADAWARQAGGAGALRFIDPVGYLQMVALELQARMIFTDSGGVQREGFFAGIPTVILRDTTEWTEIVASGWSELAGWKTDDILAAHERLSRLDRETPPKAGNLFGGGGAAGATVDAMESRLR